MGIATILFAALFVLSLGYLLYNVGASVGKLVSALDDGDDARIAQSFSRGFKIHVLMMVLALGGGLGTILCGIAYLVNLVK